MGLPDQSFGQFSKDQAREIWSTVKALRSSGVLKHLSKFSRPEEYTPYFVMVLNTSDEDIPPFACMQLDGTEIVTDASGISRTLLKVKKPDRTDGEYVFNHDNPIPIDYPGTALPWGLVRMLTNGSIEVNERYGATIDAWEVQRQDGGPFVVYGPDHYLTNIAKGRILGGSGSNAQVIEFQFPELEYPEELPEKCEDRLDAGSDSLTGIVLKVRCGGARPVYSESEDGLVPLSDDLGLLAGRDYRDIAGRIGLAVLLGQTDEYGQTNCQWVIQYVDFHREEMFVRDIIFSENLITIERVMAKVWDYCRLPDEEIEGVNCEDTVVDYYYSGDGI